MKPEDVDDIELARLFVAAREAQAARERSGYNRVEFAALARNEFTVAALRAWESGRRRPRGRTGIAYGRALREALS